MRIWQVPVANRTIPHLAHDKSLSLVLFFFFFSSLLVYTPSLLHIALHCPVSQARL